MSHDSYDDGLVHSHSWACSERGRMAQPPSAPGQARRQEGDYDDGLVHSHGWACSERGRMAGG
ncbi:hypothetical protein [Falsiroseomonas sp.]|uniref:hypothetical protein n=1 Tax=Falsiroseomonas sp. TaxID=2870721 RepID=UPI003F6F3357